VGNSDVLTGYPKREGILLALRSLAPEVILCDELGGEDDAAALETCFHTGVRFFATLHAGSADEALARPVTRRLLNCGAFDWLVQLEDARNPCKIAEVRKC
jgi:stage III sporulation protein AA